MDNQTILNILLSIATVYLAIKNYLNNSRKESMRESQEMTEIKVQLAQVMNLLQDLQKDVRTSTADFRALSERVVKLETKIDTAFALISEMKGENNGK